MLRDSVPLRILHVSPYAPAAWAYGGIPRLVGTIARTLADRGHRVTVCTTDACDRHARLTGPPDPHAPQDTSRGKPEWQVFPNRSNYLAYRHQGFLPRGLREFLRMRAAEFDVAHLHACRNLPGVMAASALRRAGVPYVLAPNGTAPAIERALVAKRVFDLVAGRRVIAHAAAVLAVSRAEVGVLTALGIPGARIHHVPNPVDLDEFHAPLPRGAFRRAAGIGDAPLVLFLGKITPRKRVDVLVEAVARLPRQDIQLVVAGNDMGARRDVETAVARWGLGARTRFTGLLSGRGRLEALAAADVVVYPSEHEIFGLVPLEALLAGTPVVVTGDSGCGEVVASVDGGPVVQTGDVVALADAIADVLASPIESRARATAAAVRVRAAYGAAGVVSRLEALYRSLCAERAVPA